VNLKSVAGSFGTPRNAPAWRAFPCPACGVLYVKDMDGRIWHGGRDRRCAGYPSTDAPTGTKGIPMRPMRVWSEDA
jgi:hypothetical protein